MIGDSNWQVILLTFPDMFSNPSPSNPLCQGDIFTDRKNEIVGVEIPEAIGYLILTYTCDLHNLDRISYIQFCPILTFHSYLKLSIQKKRKEIEEGIKTVQEIANGAKSQIVEILKGNSRRFFFLSPLKEFESKPTIANVPLISSTHKTKINQIQQKRINSLNNPWRERLGYLVGYQFNRIALKDVDKDTVEIIKVYFDEVIGELSKENKSDTINA